MHTLVTGSTGFLGGHLVDGLLSRGHDVRCLVRNMDKAKRLTDLGLDVVVGDLRDAESLKRATKGIDCVFHAAAWVNDWGRWEDFYSNTVLGTSNMVKAAISSKVTRIIHVSSVDVYDHSLFMADKLSISEDANLTKENDPYYYSRSKMLAEREIVNKGSHIEYTIIRPATIYGPRDMTILPKVVEYLKSPIAFLVRGYDPVLGLVHVYDVADLCITAASSTKSNEEAYNASSDEEVRLRSYISMVCSGANIARPKFEIPCLFAKSLVILSELYSKTTGSKKEPLFSRGALGFFIDNQCFDISKSKRDLGWSPKISTVTGVKESIYDFLRES